MITRHAYSFLFAACILSISCSPKKKKTTTFEDHIHPTDTACFTEVKRAKTDIENKKLIYCNYTGNIVYQALRSEKVMDSLLAIYKIEYQNESSPCVTQPNINYHCYCQFMQDHIVQKFGRKFTDSLLRISDSLYILKHPDLVFDHGSTASSWDEPSHFPGDTDNDATNHSGLQAAFEKLVTYPKNYRYKKGGESMAMIKIYLDIDQRGKASVTNTEMIFWDSLTRVEDYNKEYWKYFKSIAIQLIENTTWAPATIKSIPVKSINEIFIGLK